MTTRQQLIDASIADVFGGDPSQFDVKTDLQSWANNGKASGYFDANGKWHWLIYNDSTTLGGPNPQPNYSAVLTSQPIYVGTGPASVAALRFIVDQYVPAMTVVHWEARWGTDIEMKVATPYINAIVPGSSGPYVVDSLTCPNVLVNWTSSDPTNLKISCIDPQGHTHPALVSSALISQVAGFAQGVVASAVAQPTSGSTGGTQSGGGSGSGPPQQGQTQRLYTPIGYNSYPPRTHSAYNALRRMGIDHVSGKMYASGDTHWQWQEYAQAVAAGQTPPQPPEDGLWYIPADIDAFNPDSRQAVYVDEFQGAFYDSLLIKDFTKMAFANVLLNPSDNDTLYAVLTTGAVPGFSNHSRLAAIDVSSAIVTDRGNITNPNTSIPSLQLTITDIVYDYHNNRMLIVVWEQYTKATNYYTLNGAPVAAPYQQRAVFRNAVHVLQLLTGVNPIQRLWTSKEIVMPDSPHILDDAGYYKFTSVAMSSQNGKMYASAMKPFAETDFSTPERWLISFDINTDGSDVEIDRISGDTINSICYNPNNNRLFGNLYNGFSTAEIEKSDVGFDAATIPPPVPPASAGAGGGTSGGGTGGGGAPSGVLMLNPPTATIANAIENTSYSQNLTAVNGVGPYSWSVIAGALPPGFTLSGSATLTEVLSATAPLTPGTYTFTIQVQDSLGAKAHSPYTLVVAPATGLAGFPRQPGAMIVDVLGTGATNDVVSTRRLSGVGQSVWSGYDFLVVTMLSSRVGQLVEIEFGDLGLQSQLSLVQASPFASAQAKTQQQAVLQSKLSLARSTGSLSLATGIARQPVYNRVLVNFQQENQPQDILIPIDPSRFPAGSSLSYIGFRVVDASQQFAFAVTRIELQKTLGTTAQGFLTQTEQLLKNFGLAAPFAVDDYRAMAKFIQYRVVLTSQVPPISPKIIDKTTHEINPATVYNHPLSRLRGGRRRTHYASDQTIGLENVDYTQTPISIPGGCVQDGFGLEPSKEPVYDPLLFFGLGGAVVSVPSPF